MPQSILSSRMNDISAPSSASASKTVSFNQMPSIPLNELDFEVYRNLMKTNGTELK